MKALDGKNNAIIAVIRYSVDVNDSSAYDLTKYAAQFNTQLNDLSKSEAVTRDQTVNKIFSQYKDSITAYSQSVSNLATSLEKYRILLISCSALVGKISGITTTNAFDTAANTCSNSIQNAKSVSDSSFKSQFVNDYTVQAEDLLADYRQQISAGTNKSLQQTAVDAIASTKQKIAILGQKKLDLSPRSPVADLQKISDILTIQKNKLIR